MNIFEQIIEFILNYIIGPIVLIILGIWKLITKFITDVTKHIYGKILVPIVAISLFVYLIQLLMKWKLTTQQKKLMSEINIL